MKRLYKANPLRSTPASGDFNFDSIPDELKKLRRWVNWRVVQREGKLTKIPINPTNDEHASCADPSTWGTYDQAVERFKRDRVDGIGFQLGAGYVGVDLDKCRHTETGVIEPLALERVRKLNSYTEVSPSGTGVHIIAKGSLPQGPRRRGEIEMYCEGRFFTMTGWQIEGTPTSVEERSRSLGDLHRQIFFVTKANAKAESKTAHKGDETANSTADAELLARAGRAENGAKFARLWAGDWTGYDSQSEADLALCMILAFWTGRDAARIDRLFRQSGLHRDKWDDRHRADGRTYGQITVNKAIEKASEVCRPGRRRENSSPDPGLIKQLADWITVNERFAQDLGGRLYRFNAGVYKPDGSAHVKRLVKRLLENWSLTKKWSSARSEEVVEFIRVDAQPLWECPPLHVLNLANGLLHIETGQLKPHSTDHMSSVQLPVVFDPTATCPVWDGFVEDVFPDDAREVPWQIASWLMVPDTSLQKAILLLGEGSNGKSTFLTGLSAFLGPSNVAAVSLHRLESDRFSVARLVGKLANMCADLPSSHLAGTSVFKELVGGDRLPAEYKYRDSFEFLPFARLIFSANHPPRSGDSTQAFFRRWLVVPFTRKFEGGDEIRDMAARLAAPRELSGLLNRALLARKHMQECGGLIESPSMCAAREEFRRVTDPVAVWLDNWTVEKSDVFVSKNELLIAYNRTSEAAGRPPETETAFGRALHRLRPNLRDGQRTVGGKKGVWVWLGLGLRPSENE
jgi:putative DNA primase/helicase